MDVATSADLVSRPGIDPRTWVSWGTVARRKRGSDAEAVQYTDVGPLVLVRLEPANVTIQCRVADASAGDGEGEWSPFVEGDEVIVVIPNGNEREGGVILGRLANGKDKAPTKVAGMDATKNNLAFARKRTPYAMEVAAGWLVRQSPTGAFISLKETGEVTLGGGEGGFVTIRPDFVGMQSSDGSMLVQLDEKAKALRLEADGGVISLKGGASSVLTDQLALVTGGLFPAFHAATIEAVVAVLDAFADTFSALIGTALTPTAGSALATIPAAVALGKVTAINAAIAAASSASISPYAAAIVAGLAAKTSSPTGTTPGLGTPSVLLG